jgi:hypothetical protein
MKSLRNSIFMTLWNVLDVDFIRRDRHLYFDNADWSSKLRQYYFGVDILND